MLVRHRLLQSILRGFEWKNDCIKLNMPLEYQVVVNIILLFVIE